MTEPIRRSEEEMAASAEKDRAEAEKFRFEALKAEADLQASLAFNKKVEYDLDVASRKHTAYLNTDFEKRVHRFSGQVTDQSVDKAIFDLVNWHRTDPECDITLIIDSPGGDIISGFALFDTITWLRAEGHDVTTMATGMAASMGGVLLQAGTSRVMSPGSSLLIHEASFATGGSFGQIEDQVEYVKKLQERILDILEERSTLSKRQIKTRWARKNWWLMAPKALELGFIDAIA